MNAAPTPEELDLLRQLVEDGWPIEIFASPDEEEVLRFQRVAASLMRQGLAGVYGRPSNGFHIPLAEAEAIVSNRDAWDGWMISITESGADLLGVPKEW